MKDTGIGIAPEDQARVFEEFRQVGRDYTRKQEGTGLGLALTRRFVELHGGQIRLEERAGQGLDVYVYAAANGDRAAPVTSSLTHSPQTGAVRTHSIRGIEMSLILIVEDNEKNLKLVRDVLQVKGYQTVDAGTAEEGLMLARERKPDLVLMDIQLPGMNGIDALKALRADPATAAIPIVAITASVMQTDRQQIVRRRLRRLHREARQPEESPRHRAAGRAKGEP